jgi:hypothetical protein
LKGQNFSDFFIWQPFRNQSATYILHTADKRKYPSGINFPDKADGNGGVGGMYVSGGPGPFVTGAATTATGTGLAFTGFPIIGFVIVGISAIVVGFVCLRIAMVRRSAKGNGVKP